MTGVARQSSRPGSTGAEWSLNCQTVVLCMDEIFGEFGVELCEPQLSPTAAQGGSCSNRADGGHQRLSRDDAAEAETELPTRWRLQVSRVCVCEDTSANDGTEAQPAATATAAGEEEEKVKRNVTESQPRQETLFVIFDEVMDFVKPRKVVKLEAGQLYSARVCCYSKARAMWTAWSPRVRTATLGAVRLAIQRIGEDCVDMRWGRAARQANLVADRQPEVTRRLAEVDNCELRLIELNAETGRQLRKDIDGVASSAVAYAGRFSSVDHGHTVHGLRPRTAYVVYLRYETLIHTMRNWTAAAVFMTEAALQLDLVARGEDGLAVRWHRPALPDVAELPRVEPNLPCTLPHTAVRMYELHIESDGGPPRVIERPVADEEEEESAGRVYECHCPGLNPNTTYQLYVRGQAQAGRWGARSNTLTVRTAARPLLRAAATGETFLSLTWCRRPNAAVMAMMPEAEEFCLRAPDAPDEDESAIEYVVRQRETGFEVQQRVELTNKKAAAEAQTNELTDGTQELDGDTTTPLRCCGHRVFHVEGLTAGLSYHVRVRLLLDGQWGPWTEPQLFRTLAQPTITLLERGEDFFTVRWPTAAPGVEDHHAIKGNDQTCRAELFDLVVHQICPNGARVEVLHESTAAAGHTTPRVGSAGTTKKDNDTSAVVVAPPSLRVGDLQPDTLYEVQVRSWQRNALSGYEGWGAYSAPTRVRTLQPVALHVLDIGEDFAHLLWRRDIGSGFNSNNNNNAAQTNDNNDAGETGGQTASDEAAGAMTNAERTWEVLKYEVVVGCVDTATDAVIHRFVLDTTYTVTNLKPATTYVISVRACDVREQWGTWSTVRIRTLAPILTTVHEIGEDFVRLMWQREQMPPPPPPRTLRANNTANGPTSSSSSSVIAANETDEVTATVMTADLYVSKYYVLVYSKELPGVEVVPEAVSGYPGGGGRTDLVRREVVTSEHTSWCIRDLLPDREYIAVVRAATASGKWGLWSRPIRLRTNPPFVIPVNQLSIGENYVNLVWSRAGEEDTAATATSPVNYSEDDEVLRGDMTVTGQQLRIQGVHTPYFKDHTLEPDLRELKIYNLSPASAYSIQLRVCGASGCWGLWSAPVYVLTRNTILTRACEVAEDYITIAWERRKVANPNHYPTGRGVVTAYHLRVYNHDAVHSETFLGDGDCPYRITGLKPNTYYCVELKASYNDEEWGLWSTPLWCLTMQTMQVNTRLISEEFCELALVRPVQQRRLPEDDGNKATEEKNVAFGQLRPNLMLCVTTPILTPSPYNTTSNNTRANAPRQSQQRLNSTNAAATPSASPTSSSSLPPDAAEHRLVYQAELVSTAEVTPYTIPNLRSNTVYSVAVRTKLANGEWSMWSPSTLFATVPSTQTAFASIGEHYVTVEWSRRLQVIPPQIGDPNRVKIGLGTFNASRVRIRELGGSYQHVYSVEDSSRVLRLDQLAPATTYAVAVQTFNDNQDWGLWSEESKVRTVPGMQIHVQHVSEDALWVSWTRRIDLAPSQTSGTGGGGVMVSPHGHTINSGNGAASMDHDTVLNVNIMARSYEVCVAGAGGFRYTKELDSSALFFRGLQPGTLYTVSVRALFAETNEWGLWSSCVVRTKPRWRLTFGIIGEHFAVVEWRRHLPELNAEEAAALAELMAIHNNSNNATTSALEGNGGAAHRGSDGSSNAETAQQLQHALFSPATTAVLGVRQSIVETDDVVQQFRLKVQRVGGDGLTRVYDLSPTVSSFRLKDLHPSAEYRLWMCTKGYEDVWGLWNAETRVRTLPKLQLDINDVGEDYVRVRWQRAAWAGPTVEDDGEAEVRQVEGAASGYQVRVRDRRGNVVVTQVHSYKETSCLLSGLQHQTLYSIEVCAKDTYDEWGLWSDPRRFVTLGGVRTGLVNIGETFLDVEWARGLRVSGARSETTRSSASSASSSSYSQLQGDDGALPSSEDKAFDDEEDEEEDEEEGYRDDVYVEDAAVTQWHVRLQCSRVSGAVPGSEDYREFFVEGDVNWRRIDHLLPYATYTIAVRGRNQAGEWGHWSPSLVATTYPLLTVTVQTVGETFIHLTWTRPACTEDARLYDPAVPVCFPERNGVHNYRVSIRPFPGEPAFDPNDEPLEDEGARVYETTQPTLRLGNLTPGTRYLYSVREQPRDTTTGKLCDNMWGEAAEGGCVETVPPLKVIPTEIGEDYCLVEWRRVQRAVETTSQIAVTHYVPSVTEYELHVVRLAEDAMTPYSGPLALDTVESLTPLRNEYHIANLLHSTIYEVRVRAKADSGVWGPWSPVTRLVTLSRLRLSVEAVYETNAIVSWTRPLPAWAIALQQQQQQVEQQAKTRVTSATTASVSRSDAADAERVNSASTAPPVPTVQHHDDDEEEEEEEEEMEEEEVSSNGENKADVMAALAQVILGDYTIDRYEVVVQGLSCVLEKTLTVGKAHMTISITGLRQNELYTVAVRSRSENAHWSQLSNTEALLTLCALQASTAHLTESTAVLRWWRPASTVTPFAPLLNRRRVEAERLCDERERQDLFELKRRVQELELQGEEGMSGWVDETTRQAHNALRRQVAIHPFLPEHVHMGEAGMTGFHLRLYARDRNVRCCPRLQRVTQLHWATAPPTEPKALSVTAAPTQTSELTRQAASSVHDAASRRNGATSAGSRATAAPVETTTTAIYEVSVADEEESEDVAHDTAEHSNDDVVAITDPAAVLHAGSLIDVTLRGEVDEVTVTGLRPDTDFTFHTRACNGRMEWQPWCGRVALHTLSCLTLCQSRFGEHYINLYWHRIAQDAAATMAAEAARCDALQAEFHDMTPAMLEAQQQSLSAEAYTELVARLHEMRDLRHRVEERRQQLVNGHMPILVDAQTPVRGYQLRVVQESGVYTEHYISCNTRNEDDDDEEEEEESEMTPAAYTVTGLRPNCLYVCLLCADYGNGLWGEWTAPLKFITQNLIQLQITYMSEAFVDIEWRRMDNKTLALADREDTLRSDPYASEEQAFQVRIVHDDRVSGAAVEEYRDMRACNVFRVDRLLPDTKYTFAVREWDAKGDWGLWCTPRTCVTLPGMSVAFEDVGEDWAVLSWSRDERRVDYDNDMHVLQYGVETMAYYLRIVELVEPGATGGAASIPSSSLSWTGSGPEEAEGAQHNDCALDVPDVVGEEDKSLFQTSAPRQDSGPLPPQPPPRECDGPGRDGRYRLVKHFEATAERYEAVGLQPNRLYCVQVRSVTTGKQLGMWSAPRCMRTLATIQLTASFIDEQYIDLSWQRPTQSAHGLLRAAHAGRTRTESMSSSSGNEDKTEEDEVQEVTVYVGSYECVQYELEASGPDGYGVQAVLKPQVTSYRLRGLALNTRYTVRVRSTNDKGQLSRWTTPLPVVTLQPVRVLPGQITESTVRIEWGRSPAQDPSEFVLPGEDVAETTRRLQRSTSAASGYQLRVLQPVASAGVGARLEQCLDKYFGGDVAQYDLTGLQSNALYVVAVRAMNARGEWGLWSAERSVYTMRLLTATVAAVGVDYVRLQWHRDAPEEYQPPSLPDDKTEDTEMCDKAGALAIDGHVVHRGSSDEGNDEEIEEEGEYDDDEENDDEAAMEEDEATEEDEGVDGYGVVDDEGQPLSASEDAEAGRAASVTTANATMTERTTRQLRARDARLTLLDRPSPTATGQPGATSSSSMPVYRSARTTIKGFAIFVTTAQDEEGYTLEVEGGAAHAFTVPGLRRNTTYLLAVRALYGSGEWGPWSRSVRTNTTNLLISEVKAVGEDYVTTTWRRLPSTIAPFTTRRPPRGTASTGPAASGGSSGSSGGGGGGSPSAEGTELRRSSTGAAVTTTTAVHAHLAQDSEEALAAMQFGSAEETVCYEIVLHDFTDVPFGEEAQASLEGRPRFSRFVLAKEMQCTMSGLQSHHRYRTCLRRWFQPLEAFYADCPAVSPDTADTHIHDLVARTHAVPGVWSEPDYGVTLRDMVCIAEHIGEDTFTVRWERDGRVASLPVQRQLPPRPVQSHHLRVDELVLPDGATVDDGPQSFHVDEVVAAGETSFTAHRLRPHHLYRVQIRCCIDEAWGRWSRAVYVLTAPKLQLSVSRISEGGATIAWRRQLTPITLPDGTAATIAVEAEKGSTGMQYQLEVGGLAGSALELTKRLKGGRTSYVVRHLEPNSLYSARVRACHAVTNTNSNSGNNNSNGGTTVWSLWSEPVYFMTLMPIVVQVRPPAENFAWVDWHRPSQSAVTAQDNAENEEGADEIGADVKTVDVVVKEGEERRRVQLGDASVMAYHICVFNTQHIPSVAVVDKQLHKDVHSYRIPNLRPDTSYVVIVRACSTEGEWGLWSEERSFSTRRLLQLDLRHVGERYLDLKWERESNEQAIEVAQPASYAVALRGLTEPSLSFERTFAASECTMHADDPLQLPCYRIDGLQPGTEYVLALQPCYENEEWGLWSAVAHVTTLQPLEIEAEVDTTNTSLTLHCARVQTHVSTVSFATTPAQDRPLNAEQPGGDTPGAKTPGDDKPADGVAAKTDEATADQAPAGLLPQSHNDGLDLVLPYNKLPRPTTHATTTVKKYHVLLCRTADVARVMPPELLEPGMAMCSGEGPATQTNAVTQASAESVVHASDTQPVLGEAETGGETATNGHTTPDVVGNKEKEGKDVAAEAAFKVDAELDAEGGAERGWTWHYDGLAPDTEYSLAVRAMDHDGEWGAWVTARCLTAPLPPTGLKLCKVNAQYCSLQWVAPHETTSTLAPSASTTSLPRPDGTYAINGKYRYVVEQCYVVPETGAAAAESIVTPNTAPTTALSTQGGVLRPVPPLTGGSTRKSGTSINTTASSTSKAATLPALSEWQVVDSVTETVCAVRVLGPLSRLRCRVRCARLGHGDTSLVAPLGPLEPRATIASQTSMPFSAYSAEVALSSGSPPEPVTELKVRSLASDGATLDWRPAAGRKGGKPSYRVYLAAHNGPATLLTSAAHHKPTYIITDLLPATEYTVQVVAENADGVSYSNPTLRFTTLPAERRSAAQESTSTAGGTPLGAAVDVNALARAEQADIPTAKAFPAATARTLKPHPPKTAKKASLVAGATTARAGRRSFEAVAAAAPRQSGDASEGAVAAAGGRKESKATRSSSVRGSSGQRSSSAGKRGSTGVTLPALRRTM